VRGFTIDRRLFISGMGAAALAACARRGGGVVPSGPAVQLPTPKGSRNPASVKIPPMVRTPIQPSSAMTRLRPDVPVNIPLSWTQLPGTASQIAASPDGSIWALSDGPAGPDKYIWHYSGGRWTNIPGMASRIAVDGSGTPYVINAEGGIYSYSGGSWTGYGGSARSIAVSLDATNHPIYVLTDGGSGPDYGIWRYQGGTWTPFLGGGTSLQGTIDPTGTYAGGNVNPLGVYLINSVGAIYYMKNDNEFYLLPGSASQIAPAIAGYFALQYPADGGGENRIYYYDYTQQGYTQQAGDATCIAYDDATLYALSSSGAIFASPADVPVPLVIDATQANLPVGTQVYAYIVGGISTNGGVSLAAAYHLDAGGNPIPMATADSTIAAGTFPDPGHAVSPSDTSALAATYPQAWADYSIPISLSSPTVIDFSKINTTTVPGLGTGTAAFSGRIYLSIGIPKLPFTPTSSSGYTQPGYLSTDAGSMLLWDDMEFSYDSAGDFNCNPTQVNGIGLVLTLDGSPGGTLMGKYAVARDVLLSDLAAADTSYGTLLTPNTTPSAFPAVTDLRIQSPGQAIAATGYSGGLTSSFENNLNAWYATWANADLTVTDVNTGTWVGRVSSTGLLFTYQNGSATGTQGAPTYSSFTYSGTGANGALSSTDVWLCAATGPDDFQNNVQKIVLAAFNRGVVSGTLDDGACPDPSTFYPTGAGAQESNQYSKLVHGYAVPNSANGQRLAYGFAFDDVCGANPSITLSPARSITVTLRPLSGSA